MENRLWNNHIPDCHCAEGEMSEITIYNSMSQTYNIENDIIEYMYIFIQYRILGSSQGIL